MVGQQMGSKGIESLPSAGSVERVAALSGWVGLVAVVQAAVLVATSWRYGYHEVSP
jgi:hypothetical protein